VAPGIALSYAVFEAAGRRFASRAACLGIAVAGSLLLANPVVARIWPVPAVLFPRAQAALVVPRLGPISELGPDLAAARQRVIQFVEDSSPPEEAVFFGNFSHDRVDVNEAGFYFLVDRRPGTRYVHFDPNIVDRPDIQRQMITQLEQKKVRVVVLSSRVTGPRLGASLLDQYFAQHFPEQAHVGPYSLRLAAPGR
jgi:hypothetical protein